MNLLIASYNVNRIKTIPRVNHLDTDFLPLVQDFDLLTFQEWDYSNKSSSVLNKNFPNIHFNEKFDIVVAGKEKYEVLDYGECFTKVDYKGFIIYCIHSYYANTNYAYQKQLKFYRDMIEDLKKSDEITNTIIIGDFNIRRTRVGGNTGKKLQVDTFNELVDLGFNVSDSKPTWYSDDMNYSADIDRVLVSKDLVIKEYDVLVDVRRKPYASDHAPITIKIEKKD